MLAKVIFTIEIKRLKICPNCNEEKPIWKFPRDINVSNSYNDLCKECRGNRNNNKFIGKLDSLNGTNDEKYENILKDLNNKDKKIRLKSIEKITKLNTSESVKYLIVALSNQSLLVRIHARKSLVKMGNVSVDPLIKALTNENYNVRCAAAEALGDIKDSRAVNPLHKSLKDSEELVRTFVVEALGKLKDERAIKPLIESLNDEKMIVRKTAIKALGNYNNDEVIEVLILELENDNIEIKSAAIEALSKNGNIKSLEFLKKSLNEKSLRIQVKAQKAIKNIQSRCLKNSINKKVEIWEIEKDIAITKKNNLSKSLNNTVICKESSPIKEEINNSKKIDFLIKILKEGNWKLRMEAAKNLGNTKDIRAINPLIVSLDDSSRMVKNSSYDALKKIGNEAIDPLIISLKDENWNIRDNSAKIWVKWAMKEQLNH